MEWEPRDDAEVRLAELLFRLGDQIYGVEATRPEPSPILGLGVAFVCEEARPLILVHEALVRQEVSPAGFQSVEDFERALLPAEGQTDLLELLAPLDLPYDVVFLAMRPPEPFVTASPTVAPGRACRCKETRERGTMGFLTNRGGPQGRTVRGFITAGHCTAGVGSTLEAIRERRILGTQYTPVGKVCLHSDPVLNPGQAGYDVALADGGANVTVVSIPPVSGVATLSPFMREPVPVEIYAGVSGKVEGALVASLMSYGSPACQWKDSWLMVPSGATTFGDSGAAVLVAGTREGAGIVVGGSRQADSGQALVQYVQDLDSLSRDVLAPTGAAIG
jgi:hypothetical protein